MEDIQSPKVFISYSHDNDIHKEWVLVLATHLRLHGVDVILDQWDARLGDDLPLFMEKGLSSSNLVLCICSDKYVEKTNMNQGGAGYEKRILTTDLMNNSSLNYIVPIKKNNTNHKMPTFVGGIRYIDFENNDNYYDDYKALLARIYNEDTKAKPPLGKNPFKSDALSHHISNEINLNSIQFYNPALCDKISFDYKKNNGDYNIGSGDYQFSTHWSAAGMGHIYCYDYNTKRLGYNPCFTEYPQLSEIKQFDFSSHSRIVEEGQIVILENGNNKFAAIKVTKVFYNSVDIDHLLEFEYKIYDEIQ